MNEVIDILFGYLSCSYYELLISYQGMQSVHNWYFSLEAQEFGLSESNRDLLLLQLFSMISISNRYVMQCGGLLHTYPNYVMIPHDQTVQNVSKTIHEKIWR